MGNLKEFLEESNMLDDFEYFKEEKKRKYQHEYYLKYTKPKRQGKTTIQKTKQ